MNDPQNNTGAAAIDEGRAIATKWVARFGLGFHPDTPGKDYTPRLTAKEAREYDADMDRLFALDCDPYECGLAAMRLHAPDAFA